MKQQNKSFLRDVLGGYMVTLGEKDERVTVVNADLMGTCRNRTFVEKFPHRAYNVGIAEQDMVSFAAGLAHEGLLPYAFSMAPFISMRACEQCRTDVAYADVPVRLVAAYAGVSGGISGATHWSLEDCAIMTAMPGMTVLEPCDGIQAQKMLDASLTWPGPIYIRSSVEAVEDLYDETYCYEIGKATTVRAGDDGAFLCSGVVVQYARQAAEMIAQTTGLQVRVVDMHTIKPIDRQAVLAAAKTGHIIAAQDHNVVGGLGYAAAAALAEAGAGVKFRILGVPDRFTVMGHAPWLYHQFGYDSEGLAKAMLQLFGKQYTAERKEKI